MQINERDLKNVRFISFILMTRVGLGKNPILCGCSYFHGAAEHLTQTQKA